MTSSDWKVIRTFSNLFCFMWIKYNCSVDCWLTRWYILNLIDQENLLFSRFCIACLVNKILWVIMEKQSMTRSFIRSTSNQSVHFAQNISINFRITLQTCMLEAWNKRNASYVAKCLKMTKLGENMLGHILKQENVTEFVIFAVNISNIIMMLWTMLVLGKE